MSVQFTINRQPLQSLKLANIGENHAQKIDATTTCVAKIAKKSHVTEGRACDLKDHKTDPPKASKVAAQHKSEAAAAVSKVAAGSGITAASAAAATVAAVAVNAKLNEEIQAGDLKAISREEMFGAQLQHPGGTHDTPFNVAISTGNMTTIQYMFQCGCDVNFSHGTASALNHAIKLRMPHVVEFLIQRKADIFLRDRHGVVPFEAGVASGDPRIAELMVRQAVALKTRFDDAYAFILHEVIFKLPDQVAAELCELILANGADANHPNSLGFTPLVFSISCGKQGVTKVLVKAGALMEDAEQIILSNYAIMIWDLSGPIEIQGKRAKIVMSGRGSQRELIVPIFIEIFDAFLKNSIFAEIDKSEMSSIVHNVVILSGARPYDVSKHGYDPKMGLLVFGGYKKHAIGFLIAGDKLSVCNRGVHAADVRRFSMKKDLEMETIVGSTWDESEEGMNKKLVSLGLSEIDFVTQTASGKYNCSWANLASSITAIVLHIFEDKNLAFQALLEFENFAKEYIYKKLGSVFPDSPLLALMKPKATVAVDSKAKEVVS